jgi:3-hydroxyacyl-CoA dehydrogenase
VSGVFCSHQLLSLGQHSLLCRSRTSFFVAFDRGARRRRPAGTDGDRTPLDDPEIERIIADARAGAGITPRRIRPDEIVDRVLTATANEAALVLAEGIAARPGDVDLLLTRGHGFPERLGGPCHWAATRPPAELAAAQQRLADAIGPGFRFGDPALLRAVHEEY